MNRDVSASWHVTLRRPGSVDRTVTLRALGNCLEEPVYFRNAAGFFAREYRITRLDVPARRAVADYDGLQRVAPLWMKYGGPR